MKIDIDIKEKLKKAAIFMLSRNEFWIWKDGVPTHIKVGNINDALCRYRDAYYIDHIYFRYHERAHHLYHVLTGVKVERTGDGFLFVENDPDLLPGQSDIEYRICEMLDVFIFRHLPGEWWLPGYTKDELLEMGVTPPYQRSLL